MTYAAPAFELPMPLVLGMGSPWCPMGSVLVGNFSAAAASATGPATNQAIYVPFVVTKRSTWTRGFWINGSAPTGNVSVGIYDEAGNRLATTGNVAASGASVMQSAAFTASVELTPGRYYMAIEFGTGATANQITAFTASLLYREGGTYTQAVGSNPLPATATFAAWSSQVLPYFGITRTSFAI